MQTPEMEPPTREELEHGMSTPLWRWFAFQVHREWGEAAFGLKVAELLRTRDVTVAGPLIQQITVARREITDLCAKPRVLLDALIQQEQHDQAVKASQGRRPVGV